MALISMAEWIDRHGLDVGDDGEPVDEAAPAGPAGPVHLVPAHAVRWRRHHEPLHPTVRHRLHRRALRLARVRRMRPAAVRS
jgi:hypothetical protein